MESQADLWKEMNKDWFFDEDQECWDCILYHEGFEECQCPVGGDPRKAKRDCDDCQVCEQRLERDLFQDIVLPFRSCKCSQF